MKELIMTVGLPRSGKTTRARELGCPIVNPDSIRLALHGHAYIAEAEPMVWAIAKLMVVSLFSAGHDCVVLDATNTTRKRRDAWKDDRWVRMFYIFSTSPEECKQRAVESDREDLIPIIDRMAAGMEVVGFDEREDG